MNPDTLIWPGSLSDIPAIRQVAHACWPVAYREIISKEQIAYMLELMYSEASLTNQMTVEGHQFFLARRNNLHLGFTSLGTVNSTTSKLHKLYVLPEIKGSGIGALLLRHAINESESQGKSRLILQVNRRNPAVSFYRHHGFDIVEETVLEIGNGFVMDDYIMQKQITPRNA